MNAADEQAVELFLDEKIGFLDIETCILEALKNIKNVENPTFEDLKKADSEARQFVRDLF